MRRLVLHLAFAGLGALTARSSARENNAASNQVSKKLGYVVDGTELHVRRGERTVDDRYLLTRDAWERQQRQQRQHGAGNDDILVTGLEHCREWFGA